MTTIDLTTTAGHPVNPAGFDGCLYCGHPNTGRDSTVTQLGDALVDICRNRVMCDSRAYLTPMTKAAKYIRICLTVTKGNADAVLSVLTTAHPKTLARATTDEARADVAADYRRMHVALALITGDDRYRQMS